MEIIKFSENCNNKLDNKVFSTIRKDSPSKHDFYVGHLNEEFEIHLQDNAGRFVLYCTARLKRLEGAQLRGLTKGELMLDTGLTSPAAIFELFKIFGIEDTDYVIHLIFERTS